MMSWVIDFLRSALCSFFMTLFAIFAMLSVKDAFNGTGCWLWFPICFMASVAMAFVLYRGIKGQYNG